MTLAVLMLETTDFALMGVVLTATLVAERADARMVRPTASTWRLHLRGSNPVVRATSDRNC